MLKTALIAAALAIAPTASFALTPGRVAFDVYRNGKLEGAHVVEATAAGDALRVNVKIDLAGRVGPFSYGYEHRCAELWRAGALESVDCSDQERGKPLKRVTARKGAGGLLVSGSAASSSPAPADVLPSSWWNSKLVRQSRMLDTRTGAVTPITVTKLGTETVETAGGAVTATRYRVRGTTDADVWYDQADRWVKMSFRLRGQNFVYQLKSPVDQAPAA